jgi:hypothetical protein
MVALAELWMPIAVSAVAVFLVSSLVHMVIKWHAADYKGLPNEDQVRDVLRKAGLAPGSYNFPYCKGMKDMASPAMVKKYNEGPVGQLVIRPNGDPAMGKYLGAWFLYCVLVSCFLAYLAAHTVARGTAYLEVFRVVGTAAFLVYGLSQLLDAIWKGQRLSATFKYIADGLVYALVTAGVFGWLWPR